MPSSFKEIKDSKLRAYSRCVAMAGFTNSGEKNRGKEYLSRISPGEQVKVVMMAAYIKTHGFEATLKEIQEG